MTAPMLAVSSSAEPVLESIVVLIWEAKHCTDDRQRQIPAEFGHEIGLCPPLY